MELLVITMFLHTYSPNPILTHLGPLTIHWYGLFLSLGALAGYVVFIKLGKRYGLKTNELENLFFVTIIVGLIGARLYHVLNEWGYYAAHRSEIISIWNGGLAIHGALIAGVLVLTLFARMKKVSFWLLADITVPAVAIGQAIGRWGNYFNQELFGGPTGLPWGIPIETLNRPIQFITEKYFHPTFLYESLGSFAVFALVLLLHRARTRINTTTVGVRSYGFIAMVYFLAESLVRISTESLRVDRVPMIVQVRLPMVVSIVIALAAGVGMWYLLRRKKT